MPATLDAAPAAPTTKSPAPTGSARPPTPINPQSQKGPTQPPAFRPPSAPTAVQQKPAGAEGVVPPATVTLKSSIKDLYAKGPEAPGTTTVKPTEAPKAPEAVAPAAPVTPSVFETVNPAEAKPATPPAPDADPFEHIKAPESLSENAQTGWKALKTEAATKLKAAEQKYADAQARLEVLQKATPAELADVEKLRTDHKQALERLAVLDLQSHPDYLRQYVEPKAKALGEAKMLLADNGLPDGTDLNALLGKPRAEFAKTVSEMAAKMQDFDKSSFTAAMREAYRLQGESSSALSKANELRAGLESKSAAQYKQAFDETFGKMGDVDRLVSRVEIPDNLPPEAKAEMLAYNQAMEGVRSRAEANTFGKLNPKQAAAIGTKAAILDTMVEVVIPRMSKEHNAVLGRLREAEAELASIKQAKKPGNFSASAEAPAQGQPKPWREMLHDAWNTKSAAGR